MPARLAAGNASWVTVPAGAIRPIEGARMANQTLPSGPAASRPAGAGTGYSVISIAATGLASDTSASTIRATTDRHRGRSIQVRWPSMTAPPRCWKLKPRASDATLRREVLEIRATLRRPDAAHIRTDATRVGPSVDLCFPPRDRANADTDR